MASCHHWAKSAVGPVVGCYVVEYLDPGLFLLFQCHFPHRVTAMIDLSHLSSGLTLGEEHRWPPDTRYGGLGSSRSSTGQR